MWFPTMWYVHRRSQSHCLSLEYSMSVKLLTEHHVEFLSIKEGCTDSFESALVILPHCWKPRVTAHMTDSFSVYTFRTSEIIILYICLSETILSWERSGSVVECLTRDRGAGDSSLTSFTALWPWARHSHPGLVLVQPRKTRPYITGRSLMERKESNQTNKTILS